MNHNKLSSLVTSIMPSTHVIKKTHTDAFLQRHAYISGEGAQHRLGRLYIRNDFQNLNIMQLVSLVIFINNFF